jgi:hypothetical protein
MSCLLAGAHLVADGLHGRRHRCLVRPVRILHSATPEPPLNAYSTLSERKNLSIRTLATFPNPLHNGVLFLHSFAQDPSGDRYSSAMNMVTACENPPMPVWTVDTWRVKAEMEDHFLAHCQALRPDPLILYRDLEEPGLFWSPAKWESLEVLDQWRASSQYAAAVQSLEGDVLDHQTHVMTDVPGFFPKAASSGTRPQ